MTATYKAVSAHVADPRNMADNVNDYPTEHEGVVIVDVRRSDGVQDKVYVVAGVPGYHVGSAQASGSVRGFEDVWAFGDSLGMWYPDAFDATDHDAVLSACHRIALETWRAYSGPYAEVEA